MPVDVKGKKAVLECEKCGKKLELVLKHKTAAPELDACEKAEEEHGWGFTIGFFAMLVGHQVYCPECKRK